MKALALSLTMLAFILFGSGTVLAVDAECRGDGALAIPTWHQYVPKNPPPDCSLKTDGLGGEAVILIMMGVFDIIMFLVGFIAVFYVIYGGIKFLVSTGEPQKIAAARTTIVNALVGLGIAIVASWVIGFAAGMLG